MKALSVQYPWASWIVEGRKTIETRKWKTSYRGDLLICMSKIPNGLQAYYATTISHSGHAIGIVELVDVRPMTKADEEAAMCPIYDGAYAWVLRNPRVIKPFPVKGQLKLFEVDYHG